MDGFPEPQLCTAIGRVVVITAQIEHALATLFMAVLGGDEEAFAQSHGELASVLLKRIKGAAQERPNEWWVQPTLELAPRLDEAVEKRNMFVHGHWVEVGQVVPGSGIVVFKPQRKNAKKNHEPVWIAARLVSTEDVDAFAKELAEDHERLRVIADRLLDEVNAAASRST